jgi:pimeloyl-ACP methyl ester carboxylesterase
MENLRKYGKSPFRIAVIHGGPGAPGEMKPVAEELAKGYGVLEPLQTKATLKEQLLELKTVLENNAQLPVTLVGHSWGAMLGYIFTAENPSFVKKLILVGSGVFEDKYAAEIMPLRFSRLTDKEKEIFNSLNRTLKNKTTENKDEVFAQLGKLISRTDDFDPIPHKNETIAHQYDIYERVWKDAQEIRGSGKLLALGKNIRCPIIAIHGDYDPHPQEGVKIPLSGILKDFQFILLKNCGHSPWIEKKARNEFFQILNKELSEE